MKSEKGYTMVIVLILLNLGIILTYGMVSAVGTNSKTRAMVKTHADYYYQVEETQSKVVAWLQDNSKNLVGAFLDTEFSNNFTLGTPSLGDNEGQHFQTYTMVKMNGSNNTPMLSNNTFFGTADFPTTNHIDTNASFDAVSEFQSADLGNANARVVLVWARETQGNYEPVFRIDVLTGSNPDRGAHSYTYVYSTLSAGASSVGFYGRDWLTFNTPNNDCYSYKYSYDTVTSSWSRGAPRSNCPVGSNGAINTSSKIYGSAATLADPGVHLNPPGGNVSGSVCEGTLCHSTSLPTVNNWSGYCPVHNGDMNINNDTTLSSGGCWRDIEIKNKKTLLLTDTTQPYYFRDIDYNGNKAAIDFGNIPPGETITIYFESISGSGANKINGNKIVNPSNAPHQIEMYYIGSNQLTLNGTAEMQATLYAPNAAVEVSGNFNFYGSIFAQSLNVTGNSRINWDEDGGVVSAVDDLNFTVKKASHRYR